MFLVVAVEIRKCGRFENRDQQSKKRSARKCRATRKLGNEQSISDGERD